MGYLFQCLPWARSFCPFRACGAYMRNLNYLVLKFRKWFKNGLKAQKLLAQGIALGMMTISKAPCKGKSFVYCQVFESFCPYRATGLRP